MSSTRTFNRGKWSGTRMKIIHGFLPPRSTFMEAFRQEVTDGVLEIRNHPIFNDVSFDGPQLWDFVVELSKMRDEDRAISLAGDVLSSLGFEWV